MLNVLLNRAAINMFLECMFETAVPLWPLVMQIILRGFCSFDFLFLSITRSFFAWTLWIELLKKRRCWINQKCFLWTTWKFWSWRKNERKRTNKTFISLLPLLSKCLLYFDLFLKHESVPHFWKDPAALELYIHDSYERYLFREGTTSSEFTECKNPFFWMACTIALTKRRFVYLSVPVL